MSRTRPAAPLTLILAGALLGLAACTVPGTPPTARETIPHDAPTGQTLAQARAAIESIPGIAVTDFTGGTAPNIKGNTGYHVGISVDPGHSIQSGDALVDYIVRTTWSVGEGYKPTTQIAISSSTADGQPPFDLAAAGVKSGWTIKQSTPAAAADQYSSIVVELNPDDAQGARNLATLGGGDTWPGAAPAPLPGTVVVHLD